MSKHTDKKYQETINTLLNVYSLLDDYEKRESTVAYLFEFTATIDEMQAILINSAAKDKQPAQNRLNKLKEIHNVYAAYYFGEIYHRFKYKELERKHFDLQLKAAELAEEVEKLKKNIGFE